MSENAGYNGLFCRFDLKYALFPMPPTRDDQGRIIQAGMLETGEQDLSRRNGQRKR